MPAERLALRPALLPLLSVLVVAGLAGCGTARHAAAPAASPSPSARTVRREIHGSSVTAIGDSVMLGSSAALQRRLPGIQINAQVSRQFTGGIQLAGELARSGELRRVVVVGLGTNGPVTAPEVRELLAEIGPHHRVVLVNTFEPRSWEAEVNTTLAAAARRYRDVLLANWFALIRHRTRLLSADDVHPLPAGTLLYARLVRRAVQAAGNLPR
jgi:lysophospholipase L1-like esterase